MSNMSVIGEILIKNLKRENAEIEEIYKIYT